MAGRKKLVKPSEAVRRLERERDAAVLDAKSQGMAADVWRAAALCAASEVERLCAELRAATPGPWSDDEDDDPTP